MNFWEEKREFWRNKTVGNQIYLKQAYEVRRDLRKIAAMVPHKDVSFLDVGGYDGRIGVGDVIDFYNGFDLTKDWKSQWESIDTHSHKPRNLKEKYNVTFTSLTLIAFPPDQVQFILSQMKEITTDYIYLFEEDRIGDARVQVNTDYGGKWQYDWMAELTKAGFQVYPGSFEPSNVNGRWVRGTVKV